MKFLSSKGILGINARNLLYIKAYNPEKAINLADDKIKTKKFLSARDVPTPKLLGVISSREELESFNFDSLPNSFVVKPNCGFGGGGIIIIKSKDQIDKKALHNHILDILDGRFSVSNVSDSAFFEQLIIPDEIVGKYSYRGLPDIRIIVYNLIPVMAMLRLPTKESNGKANLHQGAIGVGIDIGTGKTTYIAKRNKIIDEIPEIGKLTGLQIPYWDQMLLMASKVQLATNLGYLAADIAIDRTVGPVLLEINARAGLSVQIANLAPLRKRLERVQGVKVTSPEKGVRIAKDLFGRLFEKEEKKTEGKKIIGKIEDAEIILKKGTKKVKALIDPSQERTILDIKIAERIKLLDTENYDDEKSTLKLKFSIKDKRIQTVVDLEDLHESDFDMVVGSRDLKDFLIDPETKSEVKIQKPILKKKINNNFEIDQEISSIDSKIKFLYYLRPVNLAEEQRKFYKDFNYNPQFTYPELKFETDTLKKKLENIESSASPLGQIFEEKKKELKKKLDLLESIDGSKFTNHSIDLFGKPSQDLVEECEKLLVETKKLEKSGRGEITAEKAKEIFEKTFESYKLKNWKVKLKEEMVTDCVAGKDDSLLLREKALFSEDRIKRLIVHEIETHILTAENGKNQPFEIFNRGLANYLITQEGLAVYNVSKQIDTSVKYNYKSLALVIATAFALENSFVKTFEKMLSYGIHIEEAFRITLKVKRGLCDTSRSGAFTKDIIYYKGFKEVENFVNQGGNLKDLYIGKLNIKDLPLVKEIDGVVGPKFIPRWL